MDENIGDDIMTQNSEKYIEKFVTGLQKEIKERERRIYSEKVLNEYNEPRNMVRIENYDSYGIIRGSCGDTMEIFLRIYDNKITDIYFMTDGCGATIACGSMVTKLAKGIGIQEALDITKNDLINALDGLPEDNLHCAALAVGTLHKAINNYHCKEGGMKRTRLAFV